MSSKKIHKMNYDEHLPQTSDTTVQWQLINILVFKGNEEWLFRAKHVSPCLFLFYKTKLSRAWCCPVWGGARPDPPFCSPYKCPLTSVALPSSRSWDALCSGEGISPQRLLHCRGPPFPRGQVAGREIQRALLLLWGPGQEVGAERGQCDSPQQSRESRLQPRHQRGLLRGPGQSRDLPAERVHLDIAQAGQGSLSLVNCQVMPYVIVRSDNCNNNHQNQADNDKVVSAKCIIKFRWFHISDNTRWPDGDSRYN